MGHAQTIVCPASSALAERARADDFAVAANINRDSDIVHAHSGRALNRAFRATLGAPAIRVMTRHVAFAPRHPWIHRLKYTHTCHGIIAVSEAVRDVLLRSGIATDRIEVIHTGIDLPTPMARKAGPFTVGHLGAFTKEKGQDIAVAAARLLPDVRFILAGEGPLLEELRTTAPSNVEFPGFIADLAKFFAQIDLFVMPSRSEAWGLAALEAMAHGVPVIASDIQGLAEIVEDGRSGWLFPMDDSKVLAELIGKITGIALESFQSASRARAGIFTMERMARETEAFYRRLLLIRFWKGGDSQP